MSAGFRTQLEAEILDEGRYDWVSFAFVAQCVGEYEGFEQEASARSQRAVDVVAAMVEASELVSGDLTKDGFHPWPGTAHQVVERLRRDAAEVIARHGSIPLAEVCWFATAGTAHAGAAATDASLQDDILDEARDDWIDMGHAMGLVHIAEGGEDQLALLRRAGALVVKLVRDGRLAPGGIGKVRGEFVPWPLEPAAAAQVLEEYLDEVLSGAKPIEPWQPCLFAVTGYNDGLPDGHR